MFKPRPRQLAVINYQGGKMGVSAVPGSGKTQTLSYLAAKLLAEQNIRDDQEILIVTLVNSAVNNFSQRISQFMQSFGLLPNIGYRVRTLHGLAHDIVRERPDLVGLDPQFQIIDDRETNQILNAAVENWMHLNPEFMINWSGEKFSNRKDRDFFQNWQRSITTIAANFIRQAKDLQLSPVEIESQLHQFNYDNELLSLGIQIYQDYQRALHYRSAVDFDDLIRLALQAIRMDPDFLHRLQNRWPYILEDEAQDSSKLQEQILREISGPNGNWIRVGDPNQAIYETFTTASPEYLISFLSEPDVNAQSLPNSGRSTKSIISLANELIRWCNEEHPIDPIQSALTQPYILSTPSGDPQPNPPDRPDQIHFYDRRLSADQEIDIIVNSVAKWLPDNQTKTAAILVPRNDRGAKVVEKLQGLKIPYVEMLHTSQPTRQTAAILSAVLSFLSMPTNINYLIRLFELFEKQQTGKENKNNKKIIQLLRSCKFIEEYLFPLPDQDWLSKLENEKQELQESIHFLKEFRVLLNRWQKAADLPINQLLITIGQDLFTKQSELALTHKLALMLEQSAKNNPHWVLPEFAEELSLIAENKRKMLGFAEEDLGFDPEAHKGKVIVSTYHKAKGLEWDRVYLMAINNYNFPSALPEDEFISEKYFYKFPINLEAETIFKLKALSEKNIEALFMEEGFATQKSRYEYAAERIRLYYVGITRAKQELIMTWNVGNTYHKNRPALSPSIPYKALQAYWELNYASS